MRSRKQIRTTKRNKEIENWMEFKPAISFCLHEWKVEIAEWKEEKKRKANLTTTATENERRMSTRQGKNHAQRNVDAHKNELTAIELDGKNVGWVDETKIAVCLRVRCERMIELTQANPLEHAMPHSENWWKILQKKNTSVEFHSRNLFSETIFCLFMREIEINKKNVEEKRTWH